MVARRLFAGPPNALPSVHVGRGLVAASIMGLYISSGCILSTSHSDGRRKMSMHSKESREHHSPYHCMTSVQQQHDPTGASAADISVMGCSKARCI